MSVAVTYVSEGNNVKGPSICAEGGLGNPDLEARSEYNEDWGVYEYTFGWIYSGLSSIGLGTEEMENFRAFLEENKGNKIFMFIEGGEDPDEDKIDWENMTAFFSPKRPEFKNCTFTITNTSNGESVKVNAGDQKLKPVEKTLTKNDIDNFIEKLVSAEMVDDSFHNTYGILFAYEEFGQIRDFISNNKEGNLILSIKEI